MPAASRLRYAQLAYFSKPRDERVLYRTVRRHRVRSIVEIGVETARRASRLISVALAQHPAGPIRYSGIDLFEANPPQRPSISLKEAHRLLKKTGASGQMVPGDAYSALARASNALTGTDLLLIADTEDAESLAQAWFYVPRMLHEHSIVLMRAAETTRGGAGRTTWNRVTHVEIEQLARRGPIRRAA